MMNRRTVSLILVVGFAAGCGAGARAYVFPATWPSPLESLLASPDPTASPAPRGPLVILDPVVLDLGELTGSPPSLLSQESLGGRLTAEALTDLLARQLRARGFTVARRDQEASGASYRVTVVVSRLLYAKRAGYPPTITYLSEATARAIDLATSKEMWQHTFERRWDRTVLVNMMSRIPDIREDEQILIRQCLLPTWTALAALLDPSTAPPPQ